METGDVALTYEFVDKIPLCDHSNEISFTVLSHGAICLAGFEKLKILIFLEFFTLASTSIERVNTCKA